MICMMRMALVARSFDELRIEWNGPCSLRLRCIYALLRSDLLHHNDLSQIDRTHLEPIQLLIGRQVSCISGPLMS